MAQYATLADAEEYFPNRLHSDLWDTIPPSDRDAALKTATRQIDRLNFVGEPHTSWVYRQGLSSHCLSAQDIKNIQQAGMSQELKFPRGSDTEVPNDLKIACMELAYELVDGRDPQKELENLAIVSQGFSAVRNTLDRSFVHEHLSAGIVSTMAWSYLRPYLRDDQDFKISRVS